MIWGLIGLYTLIALVSVRIMAGHMAWGWALNDGEEQPSGEQWFGAFSIAVCLAPVWPAALIWAGLPLQAGHEKLGIQRLELERRAKELEALEKKAGLR